MYLFQWIASEPEARRWEIFLILGFCQFYNLFFLDALVYNYFYYCYPS